MLSTLFTRMMYSALGHDASANFTTEADPRKSYPNDSLSKQQGNDEGTINISFDHFIEGTNLSVLVDKTQSARDGLDTVQPEHETNKGSIDELFRMDSEKDDQSFVSDDDEIKLEDLTELIKDKGTATMDLDSPEDDQPLLISSKDEPGINADTQKLKLEKDKAAAKANAASLTAQPSFPNVQHLIELVYMKKLEIEVLGDLKVLPRKLEESQFSISSLTFKVADIENIKLDIPAGLLVLQE
ncbi:hypothetical protein Tco_1530546 [Tanacetum coccineum]